MRSVSRVSVSVVDDLKANYVNKLVHRMSRPSRMT